MIHPASKVLLRFAPSPTGALHLGGLRTALYNHLFAKKHGGEWILRIEDTDAARTVPGAVERIREALEWAGLEYDYGPGKGGPHAPYVQSERLDLYHSYAQKLLDSGHAYRCFCSPNRLAETRERLARSGSYSTYDKACLHLTEEEVARRVRAGEKSVIRMNDGHLPSRSTPPDLVFGPLKDSHASLPTDPVLLKSDLFPTYHLASVVDDHEMGITQVVRGEEWLPSLSLHLDLYASLSLTPPQFAHLPILLNPDGTKMSKRKGDVDVLDFKRRGWEPIAILNWLALAGWGIPQEDAQAPSSGEAKQAPDSTTLMSLEQMIKEFELSSLTHRRTVLDPVKLQYLNKHHLIKSMTTDDGLLALAEKVRDIVKEAQYTSAPYIKDVIVALQGRLTNLHELPILAPYFFVDPDWASDEAHDMSEGLSSVQYVVSKLKERLATETSIWSALDLSNIVREEVRKTGFPSKQCMMILRHALSGMKTGPGVGDILRVLGRDRAIARLANAQPPH
ncbi:glutamyl-tRNA synthetase [Obba rivulosa]|uniref:Glutamate--tRNA ligase, mitochondrial n=1 Tax=Obba rivulosa TaxID=1052685 RepID=A0A8E2DR37_9APHY|nr:glutamyl-tRNA synthetase [Obba rivulosa]